MRNWSIHQKEFLCGIATIGTRENKIPCVLSPPPGPSPPPPRHTQILGRDKSKFEVVFLDINKNNKSTTFGCQRSTVKCLIVGKKLEVKKGDDSVQKYLRFTCPCYTGYPFESD